VLREGERKSTSSGFRNSQIKAENTHAAGATGIFDEKCACRWRQRHFSCFSEWADPSERATGHSLQHGNFKYVNQELHFKDFGKSIKRENEDWKQLSEMISFP